jgi:aminopeptidase N
MSFGAHGLDDVGNFGAGRVIRRSALRYATLPQALSLLLRWLALLALLAHGAARADAPWLDLDVDLDPATRMFVARAELAPTDREFRFALHESLTPTAASTDGQALTYAAAGRSGALREWRIALPAAGASRLRIDYRGTLPALDPKLDHRGVLGGLPPMASAAGSFLPSGAAWYPQPAGLFRYRVKLSVPSDQRALVAGRLTSETLPGDKEGRYRASFEFPHPADGIDLMAGPWLVREKTLPRAGTEPIRLRTYFFADLDAMPGLAEGYLDDSARYLERYAAEIGAYPFTEFSVVASPLPTGFGMPTLTYLGAEVLKLPFIRKTSLGHEVLHNWWGNGVYPDYAQGNWSEGLTTFMADYAYKVDESATAAREMRLGWLRDFAAVPADGHSPLVAFRSRTHGAAAAVGYGKAAMLFVMLRDLVGEEAFRRGIRAFWEQQRFRVAGWDDLRAAFEKASGRPLGAFFEQWLARAGGPQARIADAQALTFEGKPRLAVTIEQSGTPYALRLPMEITYGERSETRIVEVSKASETLNLDLPARAQGLRLDPELRVWRVLEREQLPPILRQWVIAKSPRLVQAAESQPVKDAAAELAQRLFEVAPKHVARTELTQGSDPILIAGLHGDIDALLAAAGLPPRPAALAGRGSAHAWTVQREAGPPLAVVSARDADSLRALQRPLPHYGSQSWVLFEGSRALERGVWPAPGRLVPVRATP